MARGGWGEGVMADFLPDGYWCGSAWATTDDHAAIELTYSGHSFASLPFMVENNLRRVHVTGHPKAANGLWTLANMKARYDLTKRQIAGMATKMRRAVELWEDECDRLS